MLKTLFFAAALCFFGWLLLFCAPAVAAGAKTGIAICGSVVIPSLFPFLVLSCVVGAVPMPRGIDAALGCVARVLYRQPAACAPALLMSWVGGYPAGAKVLAAMVRAGRIHPADASRAMTACINSGPAFMAAVAGGIFGSARVGLQIFACQLAAGVVTSWVFALLLPRGKAKDAPPRAPQGAPAAGGAETFVSAVGGAAAAALTIASFVILFSALLSGLESLGLLSEAALRLSARSGLLTPAGARCLLRGMAEICCGCSSAAALPPVQAAAVLPFLLSFSSVSVICQNAALLAGYGVNLLPMAASRIVHGALTALFTYPWLYPLTASIDVFAPSAAVTAGSRFSIAGTILMLLLAALLYITIGFSLRHAKKS